LASGQLDQGQAVTVLAGVALLRNRGHQDRLITRLLSDPDSIESRARLVRELRHDGRRIWDLPAHKLRPIIAREAAHLDPTGIVAVQFQVTAAGASYDIWVDDVTFTCN
jgi:hypothetical protein